MDMIWMYIARRMYAYFHGKLNKFSQVVVNYAIIKIKIYLVHAKPART